MFLSLSLLPLSLKTINKLFGKKEEAYSDIVKVVAGVVATAARGGRRADERRWPASAHVLRPLLTRAGAGLPSSPPRSPNSWQFPVLMPELDPR